MDVERYSGVTLAGTLPKILIYIPFWYLRLDGRNGHVTAMMFLMGGGNILLDLLFLYIWDMGVAGAALASVIATAAACLLGFIQLCSRKSSFKPGICVKCSGVSFWQVVQAGSPAALNNLFQALRVSAVNTLFLLNGGSVLVAAFTAVNCISAFEESVTGGVPQAASAMLGIYSGEHDNQSIRLLVLRELKSGIPCCVWFSVIITASSGMVAGAYGLDYPLWAAFACMSLGTVPALVNCILAGYYNVSCHAMWANAIIFLRVFLMPCISLLLLFYSGQNPWWFLFLGEAGTLAVWFAASGVYCHFHPGCSRFLLMDNSFEETGRVINFSVNGDAEDICSASSKITVFCEENGMQPKQVMHVSLAMEELMGLITSVNQKGSTEFDLRIYSLGGIIIRIRYSGIEFNPFAMPDVKGRADDMYMGVRIIQEMVSRVVYQRTFGMNTVQIYIK